MPNRNFDCDDTNLARVIYCLVWGDNFHELTFDKFLMVIFAEIP